MIGFRLTYRSAIRKAHAAVAVCALACGAVPDPAGAAGGGYPSRPVKIVVGFGPGSATDSLARLIAEPLAKALGQPVVVENRPSAGATIGADLVARAAPDGYTLMLGASSAMVVAPAGVVRGLAYDPLKDFTPLWRVSKISYLVMGSAKLPARNLREFIAHARKHPEQTNCASGNATGIAFCELLKTRTGVNMAGVPYKSTPPAVLDLVSNQVQVMLVDAANGAARARSGQLVAYGVPEAQRSALLPDVPTLVEAGLPQFPELLGWWAIWGPAGLPRPIATRLSQELERIVADAAVQKAMKSLSLEPFPGSPKEVNSYLARDLEAWRAMVRIYKLAGDN